MKLKTHKNIAYRLGPRRRFENNYLMHVYVSRRLRLQRTFNLFGPSPSLLFTPYAFFF